MGEKGGSANFKTKHTEPLTSQIILPVYTIRFRVQTSLDIGSLFSIPNFKFMSGEKRGSVVFKAHFPPSLPREPTGRQRERQGNSQRKQAGEVGGGRARQAHPGIALDRYALERRRRRTQRTTESSAEITLDVF